VSAFLLLRHAESEWNRSGRQQGWAQTHLTASGREATKRWVASQTSQFDVVASSDLARALETSTVIAAGLAIDPVIVDSGLREQHQGMWTGLTKAEIKSRWPERMRERPRHPVGGESARTLLGRSLEVLEGLAVADRARRILVITHAGVIREIERHLTGSTCPIPHLEGRWIHHLGPVASEEQPRWLLGPFTEGREVPEISASARAAACE